MTANGPAGSEGPHSPSLDFDALVATLQERAASRHLKVDALASLPEAPVPTPRAQRLARLEEAVLVEAGLHVSPSARPLVGRIITKAKRLLARAGWEAHARVADQATAFNARTAGYIFELEQEIVRLEDEIHRQNERLAALEARGGSTDTKVSL